jgi:diacylglycerol kinase family enzyme
VYFTLIEPPKDQSGYQRLARIKDQMGVLGIAGEFAMVDQPDKIAQLVEQAVSRRYSTIVVVGGSDTIARTVRALATYEDVVLGLIPSDSLSDSAALVGAKTLEENLTALQRRRWTTLPVLKVQGTHRTITPVSIPLDTHHATIYGKGWSAQVTHGVLTIAPESNSDNMRIRHEPPRGRGSWLNKLFSGSDVTAQNVSQFFEEAIALESSVPVPVIVDGSKIVMTPAAIQTTNERVKLIVAKAA